MDYSTIETFLTRAASRSRYGATDKQVRYLATLLVRHNEELDNSFLIGQESLSGKSASHWIGDLLKGAPPPAPVVRVAVEIGGIIGVSEKQVAFAAMIQQALLDKLQVYLTKLPKRLSAVERFARNMAVVGLLSELLKEGDARMIIDRYKRFIGRGSPAPEQTFTMLVAIVESNVVADVCAND